MQPLQALIDTISENRKFHISILDITGILNTPLTRIRYENVIHSSNVCSLAKSTERGGKLCLQCKRLANAKASTKRTPFSGYCIWGIYEAAHPVIIEDRVAAVVYVGNCIADIDVTKRRAKHCCKSVRLELDSFLQHLDTCEFLSDLKLPAVVAEIVGDYLKILWEASPTVQKDQHWLISGMRRHAEESFAAGISLKDLAEIYHKNEKYLGRLFKKEMGIPFHEYCNRIRIEHAKKLLLATNYKILEIALDCGFNNISYFNRVFRQSLQVSPGEFRRKNK